MGKKEDFKKLQDEWYSKIAKEGFNDIEGGKSQEVDNKFVKKQTVSDSPNGFSSSTEIVVDVVREMYNNVGFSGLIIEFKETRLQKYLDQKTYKDKNWLYPILCVMLNRGFTIGRMREYIQNNYKVKLSTASIQGYVSNLYKMFEKDDIFKNTNIIKLDSNHRKLSKAPWDICEDCGDSYLVEIDEKSTYKYCSLCVNNHLI